MAGTLVMFSPLLVGLFPLWQLLCLTLRFAGTIRRSPWCGTRSARCLSRDGDHLRDLIVLMFATICTQWIGAAAREVQESELVAPLGRP